MNKLSLLSRRILTMVVMLVLVGQACTLSLFETPAIPGVNTPVPVDVGPSPTPQAMAQTNFVVTIPEPLQANETLAIAIMDEVTGLSLNATQFPMSARDSLTYTAVLPLPFNSLVKYRYVRRGASQVLEDTNFGRPFDTECIWLQAQAKFRILFQTGAIDPTHVQQARYWVRYLILIQDPLCQISWSARADNNSSQILLDGLS